MTGYVKSDASRGMMYTGGAREAPVDYVMPVVEEVISYEMEIGIVAGDLFILAFGMFFRYRNKDSKINFLVKTVKMQNQIPR